MSPSNKKMSNPGASVTYSSTRGGEKHLDFRTVVMKGLATDRGLFVPDQIPAVTSAELQEWRSFKTFADLAIAVLSKYIKDDQVPYEKLRDIVHRSCLNFRAQPDVTPLQPVGGHMILVSCLQVSLLNSLKRKAFLLMSQSFLC
jgi:threonine synthase